MRRNTWTSLLFSTALLFSSYRASAASNTTLTQADLTSGPTVQALSQLTDHRAVATVDALIQTAIADDAMIMLSLETTADVERARPIVERALDARVDFFVEGSEALVAALQPKTTRIWKAGERLFVSNRSEQRGLVLQTFDVGSTPYRLKTDIVSLREAIDRETTQVAAAHSVVKRASGNMPSGDSSGSFELPSLIAKTPSEVCIAIRNKLVDRLADDHLTNAEIQRAVNHVCQYGTIGEFFATPPDIVGGATANGTNVVLNLSQEWMLLESEDKSQPDKSSLYLWVRTLGDDAGSGFTHQSNAASIAYASATRVSMLNVMSPRILSGWGPTNALRAASSESSPLDNLFACETNPNSSETSSDARATIVCPVRPRLLSVLPGDSFDDTVTVVNATAWTIGGSFSVTPTEPPAVTLSVNVGRTDTQTSSATLHMVRTSTNANTEMYRQTLWNPNWEAMAKWVRAKGAKDRTIISLNGASPLASVLNPAWSIVWKVPLADNAGRKTRYTSIFEAHDTGCVWKDKEARCENPLRPSWGIWSKNSSMIVSIDDFEDPGPKPGL